jgi:hypothetical protein
MTAFQVVLALVGLALGLVVLTVVLGLFYRVLRPVWEIGRYAEDTLAAGLGIARNLDGLDEINRTRELGAGLARGTGAGT